MYDDCSDEGLQNPVLTDIKSCNFTEITTKDRKILLVLQLAADWLGSEVVVVKTG